LPRGNGRERIDTYAQPCVALDVPGHKKLNKRFQGPERRRGEGDLEKKTSFTDLIEDMLERSKKKRRPKNGGGGKYSSHGP